MSCPKLLKCVFVLLLCNLATASPLMDSARVSTVKDTPMSAEINPILKPERPEESQSVPGIVNVDVTVEEKAQKFSLPSALSPVEALQALRVAAAPLINSSLAIPDNLLKKASQFSMSDMTKRFPQIGAQLADPGLRERIMAPVQDFLQFTAQRTRDAIPTALDREHLRRHYENFKRYLAARQQLLKNVTSGLGGLSKAIDSSTPPSDADSVIVDTAKGKYPPPEVIIWDEGLEELP